MASSQSAAVPCSTGYINVNTPRLFFNLSPTLWDAVLPTTFSMDPNRISCHCQHSRTHLNHSRPQSFRLFVLELQPSQRCQDECQWSLSHHCTILRNMIRSLQHHQAPCPLARPRICRCTVLNAPPQSSGQSALMLLYRHGLISFGCSNPSSVSARHDFVNVVHLRDIDNLLSHPQARLDRCCRQRRSDRLLLRGASCSGLSRPARWNTRYCSPLSRHRTVDLDCSRRCNVGLFLSSAHRHADSGLFSPAVGPHFPPTVGPFFSVLFHSGACWGCWGLLVVLVCPSRPHDVLTGELFACVQHAHLCDQPECGYECVFLFCFRLWVAIFPKLVEQRSTLLLTCSHRCVGRVPRGQWARLDTDTLVLIDRSACLVEPCASSAPRGSLTAVFVNPIAVLSRFRPVSQFWHLLVSGSEGSLSAPGSASVCPISTMFVTLHPWPELALHPQHD